MTPGVHAPAFPPERGRRTISANLRIASPAFAGGPHWATPVSAKSFHRDRYGRFLVFTERMSSRQRCELGSNGDSHSAEVPSYYCQLATTNFNCLSSPQANGRVTQRTFPYRRTDCADFGNKSFDLAALGECRSGHAGAQRRTISPLHSRFAQHVETHQVPA